MTTDPKKKLETPSEQVLAMRQRAIEEGRMGRQIELAGAYQRGFQEGLEEARSLLKAEGRQSERRILARRMWARGYERSLIEYFLDVSADELQRLLTEE
ncbi:MAG: hypothetical protein RI953_1360 [Pseudomonadota bacterium]|jgi:flagellar biosynthesis/type III secretory pathway protein FliH